MFNSFTKIIAISIILLVGCSQANNKPVSIGFNADSSAFEVKGINPVGLLELQRQQQGDSLSREWVWISSGSEKIAGRLQIKDEVLYFFPETPLEKGRSYTVNTLLNSSFGAPSQVLKGKVSYQVRPQQQVLVR